MKTCRRAYRAVCATPAWMWITLNYGLHIAVGAYIGANIIPWAYAAHKARWL